MPSVSKSLVTFIVAIVSLFTIGCSDNIPRRTNLHAIGDWTDSELAIVQKQVDKWNKVGIAHFTVSRDSGDVELYYVDEVCNVRGRTMEDDESSTVVVFGSRRLDDPESVLAKVIRHEMGHLIRSGDDELEEPGNTMSWLVEEMGDEITERDIEFVLE
jgi:hypothetical protein